MIDSRELRIGNWVETYMVMSSGGWFDKEGKHHGQNVITEPAIRQKQIDINDLKIISESQFATYRPIPLTPEILVACGFEKRGAIYIHPLTMNFEIWNRAKLEGVYRWYAGRMQKNYFLGISNKITSLHQLQNLYFALTQTEITINLK